MVVEGGQLLADVTSEEEDKEEEEEKKEAAVVMVEDGMLADVASDEEGAVDARTVDCGIDVDDGF